MSSTRLTPAQNETPGAPADNSDPIHSGSYTNNNSNPLANTLNGDTSSLAAATYIQNYQCQHPQNHYTNCHFYGGDHTPAAQNESVAPSNASAHSFHTDRNTLELPRPSQRSIFVPFYWSWSLFNSFIQVIIRATAMSIEERAPHDTLPRHIQDLENRLTTDDRLPPSSTPTPTSPADDLA
ncbi:hypothetical protein AAF712_011936 [Marasmius tenuissimus]|uniref:Uncharacterized protein n=1 Tax=Marasmius tenuissimus TaxID=585030 RepID=A0ABR2ZKI2_9AGAR